MASSEETTGESATYSTTVLYDTMTRDEDKTASRCVNSTFGLSTTLSTTLQPTYRRNDSAPCMLLLIANICDHTGRHFLCPKATNTVLTSRYLPAVCTLAHDATKITKTLASVTEKVRSRSSVTTPLYDAPS